MVSPLLRFDAHLLAWITSHRIDLLNTPMWLLSLVGRGGMVWVAVGAALAIARRISLRGFL